MTEPAALWSTTADELANITTTPGAIPTTDVLLRITGPGAVACVQGLLTNDIEKVALPGLVHAAVLTPKGMIVTPLWCWREGAEITLIVPRQGVGPLRTLLTRSLPPRLARVSEAEAGTTVWWLVGGGRTPTSGRVARPSHSAPFDSLWIGEATGPLGGGHSLRPAWQAEVLRVTEGWPALGYEIDERTLPQEVRFDELQSISYDKGCYVGQETVARLHFRGHANRQLRGVLGTGAGPTSIRIMEGGGKEVGMLASWGRVGDRWLGLSKLRREVAIGEVLMLGTDEVVVAELPLDPALLQGD